MRVGILGAGQLGRMIALAGIPLNVQFRFLDPTPNSPAGQFAEQIIAPYDDPDALVQLAESCDVVTYEFENVPASAAALLAERVPLFPPPPALQVAQDRLYEKQLFEEVGIPVPAYHAVESLADLEAGVKAVGLPCVLKTRRLGYDGKGQKVLRHEKDILPAWEELGGTPLILEAFVAFEREVSLIGVRSRGGDTEFYPLVENLHYEGILRRTLAPMPHHSAYLQNIAEQAMQSILERLDYVGVLTIEFFEKEGTLYANEMAPRVHNSGHWSIEGAETSQFENHLRAVLGLPLGSTAVRGYAAMVNLIGTLPETEAVLKLPETHLHLYGKSPRPGRKIGHINLLANDYETLLVRVKAVESLISAS
jgi:5-(carboxyamino)imidazole ribonucleotide synthase